ncbi:MAG: ISKra4 family transposase [Chloroflexota bacterium]|nr:ISKra4 family transposase [Chloroflexota bacterium]
MPSNSEPIVQQLRLDFETLLAYVTGPDAATQTAYTVELTVFRQLLALGATLLRLFFVTRAAERPAAPRPAPDGPQLTYHDCRPITYYSIFGKVRFARHYFAAPGHPGCCPLDAALSLPERCYSDLLREWAAFGATDESYRESQTGLERILGCQLSLQAIETGVQEDAVEVTAFYAQPPDPSTPVPLGPILVVQADGKGVPQAQSLSDVPRVRLGKGEKRSKKKEAVVTSLYTIAPYLRTPQDVVAALLQEEPAVEPASRPKPVAKEVHATLEGKVVALARLQQRCAARCGPQIQARVALTDGAEALQTQLQAHFPEHTLVLDIIHASEYLWDVATALLGERHGGRKAWIRRRLEQVLSGATDQVIAELEELAQASEWTEAQRKMVRTTVGYYRRNAPYMHYDEYLARGWPSGTGVVEGACRHLGKDRMEQAGMRWTVAGAQAVLDLRAARLNGDWDAYWQYHRQQQQERLYGLAASAPDTVEAQVLKLAA